MTFSVNTETITIDFSEVENLVVKGHTVTIPLENATDLIRLTLEARKAAYETRRNEKAAANAAKKAAAEIRKAERTAKAAERKAETIAKLEAKLAALQAKAA